jgi:hypothetical protein
MDRHTETDLYLSAKSWDEFNERVWPKKKEELRLTERYAKNFLTSPHYGISAFQIELPRDAESAEKESEFLRRLDEAANAVSEKVSKYTNRDIWLDTFRNRGTNKVRVVADLVLGSCSGLGGYELGGPIGALAGVAAGLALIECFIGGLGISSRNSTIKSLKELYKNVTIKYRYETLVVNWK